MTIKSNGGIFGRNPTFNNVTVDGALTGLSDLSISGNLILASGKGIDFSATSGTGTSELFDDYEEGTWTPSLGGDATYLAQTGTYTKVGNQVHIFCYIQPNVIGTGSPTAISGIPFACADAASSLSVGLWSNYPSAAISVVANVQGSLIYVSGKATATTSSGGISPFTVDGGARLRLSGTYRTS